MIHEVLIDITEDCLHRCVHCSNAALGLRPEHLPASIVFKTIRKLPSLGVKILCFSGGEPLLHPCVLDFVEGARRTGIHTVLYTSGVIRDPQGKPAPIGPGLARSLELSGLNEIFLSLHSPVPWVHDSIARTEGSFGLLLESIQALKETSLRLGVHFVPMKLNYRDIESTARFCVYSRFRELRVLRLVSQGNAAKNYKYIGLEREQLSKFLQSMSQVIGMYGQRIRISVSGFLEFTNCRGSGGEKGPCRGLKEYMYINSQGDLFPCPAFKSRKEFTVGNLFDSDLLTICNNSIRLERIRALLSAAECPAYTQPL